MSLTLAKGGWKQQKNPLSQEHTFPKFVAVKGGGGIYKEEELKVSSHEMKPVVWLDRCASYVLVTFHL